MAFWNQSLPHLHFGVYTATAVTKKKEARLISRKA
jgi:hypothetical protein